MLVSRRTATGKLVFGLARILTFSPGAGSARCSEVAKSLLSSPSLDSAANHAGNVASARNVQQRPKDVWRCTPRPVRLLHELPRTAPSDNLRMQPVRLHLPHRDPRLDAAAIRVVTKELTVEWLIFNNHDFPAAQRRSERRHRSERSAVEAPGVFETEADGRRNV